jgi:hypothetical protein
MNIGTSVRYVAVTSLGVQLQALEQRTAQSISARPGDEVVLTWPAEATHVYGAATGDPQDPSEAGPSRNNRTE